MIIGTSVECMVCHGTKKPRGRSAPMGYHMCNQDCPGYYQDPQVGQLWPRETAEDFGYPVRAYGSDIESEDGAKANES